jgi:arylsulfatase A-like enzyme
VIFIMVDDMGYGDLGCYGQQKIQTPHIDKLAKEGMRFTQCYSGSTVCAPARSVLMTGQHTGHTTVRGNFGINGRVPLRDEDVTLADIFKKEGYVTGMTGKWGLGEPGTSGVPNKQGFDEWFGYLNQRNAHSHYPPYLWKNQNKFTIKENEKNKTGTHTHELFTSFALDFIKRHHKKPFFLYIPYCVPHAKFQFPTKEPYSNKGWNKQATLYAAMITGMDRDIGRIMSLLKKMNVDENTCVMFCSDNGAADRYDGLFDSSGPLKGGKRSMHDGGLRVPMVIRYPNVIKANQVNHQPWYFADVLPTCADLINVKPPENIDGISVLPALKGSHMKTLNERVMYWEFFEGGFQQAARWKNWKAIKNTKKDISIYDLSKDVAEKNNLVDTKPELVKKFNDIFTSERTESVEWPIQSK